MDEITTLKLSPSPPNVLIFPFPVQGHVNSMLNLAELLVLAGLNVTFLNSKYNHDRLVRYTDVAARFSQHPGFQFRTIWDGLPDDHPRSGDRIMELLESLRMITIKPAFRDVLLSIKPAVSCIVGDGNMGFVIDVANELRVPIIHFRTISACCFWAYFSFPRVIEAGQLPIRESNEDMDRLVTKVAGMENFLRCRDLPSFFRSKDLADPTLNQIVNATRKSCRAQALILNTFEDLEGPILSQIRTQCPNTYTIGPLHQHLKNKLRAAEQEPHKPSNSLWEVKRSCMAWLDNQPQHSVLYVSFGSITVLTADQVLEFWHGFLGSKQRFLWVIRPNSVTFKNGDQSSEHKIPTEIVDGVIEKKHMVMVGWAPQEEVLGHRAVGGFLTHSGWNSTLESIVAGVPMICWPYFADQQLNSRFVSEVWKLGLDMKDVCNRRVVEKMVNELMVERREAFVNSTARMKELARRSVSPGGSSYHNLGRLIEDIKLMSTTKQN